jgi:wobble nucleotide-excising tRNase
LDTLGLCYFLALRAREAELNPTSKVLLMDDVLHSVDADHRGRVASLIRDAFADHQTVLMTHDRYFFDKLRASFGTSGYKYVSITDWDIERGPLIGDPSTDLDRVVVPEQRAGKAPEELAAAGGRIFLNGCSSS